jgi:hypothetical protein
MFLICFPSFLSCGGVLEGEGKRKAKGDDCVVEEVEDRMEHEEGFSVDSWLNFNISKCEHKRS